MKELSEAYTAEEVAQYLKLHPYTVRRLAREKKYRRFVSVVNGVSEKMKSINGRGRIHFPISQKAMVWPPIAKAIREGISDEI